jgi:predicted DNA-binding transcriptional regulator YafY
LGTGCITFSLTFASEEAACQELLGVGTAVEIINPLSLRQKILAMSQQLIALYM